jgi:hypothetical protein
MDTFAPKRHRARIQPIQETICSVIAKLESFLSSLSGVLCLSPVYAIRGLRLKKIAISVALDVTGGQSLKYETVAYFYWHKLFATGD